MALLMVDVAKTRIDNIVRSLPWVVSSQGAETGSVLPPVSLGLNTTYKILDIVQELI